MNKLLILVFIVASIHVLPAQEDTAQEDAASMVITSTDTSSMDTTYEETTEKDAVSLLPSHYLVTQRLLWGENGLMRQTGLFPLTASGRELELDIRYRMTQLHQLAGYMALAGMIGSGITGQLIMNGNAGMKDMHEGLTAFTGVTYFSSLGLKLLTPPGMSDRSGGFTRLNIHKAAAVVHVTSMLATYVLAGQLEHNASLRPYHRAAAITAFSSLLVATVVINL
jgi:hypothetical protein